MLTVIPETSEKVHFTAPDIAVVYADVAPKISGFDGADVTIKVDDDLPTTRVRVASLDPIVFEVDSGAFEEVRTPRHLSTNQTAVAIARLLLEVSDRRDEAFGAPELGEPADLDPRVVWDTSLYGRVSRLDYRIHQPRHLYNFRNRLGFTDAADELFHDLWNGKVTTYSEMMSRMAALPPNN